MAGYRLPATENPALPARRWLCNVIFCNVFPAVSTLLSYTASVKVAATWSVVAAKMLPKCVCSWTPPVKLTAISQTNSVGARTRCFGTIVSAAMSRTSMATIGHGHGTRILRWPPVRHSVFSQLRPNILDLCSIFAETMFSIAISNNLSRKRFSYERVAVNVSGCRRELCPCSVCGSVSRPHTFCSVPSWW